MFVQCRACSVAYPPKFMGTDCCSGNYVDGTTNISGVRAMRKVAVTVMAGTKALMEDLMPALALFAAVFAAGIYAKGLFDVSYATGSF